MYVSLSVNALCSTGHPRPHLPLLHARLFGGSGSDRHDHLRPDEHLQLDGGQEVAGEPCLYEYELERSDSRVQKVLVLPASTVTIICCQCLVDLCVLISFSICPHSRCNR